MLTTQQLRGQTRPVHRPSTSAHIAPAKFITPGAQAQEQHDKRILEASDLYISYKEHGMPQTQIVSLI